MLILCRQLCAHSILVAISNSIYLSRCTSFIMKNRKKSSLKVMHLLMCSCDFHDAIELFFLPLWKDYARSDFFIN